MRKSAHAVDELRGCQARFAKLADRTTSSTVGKTQPVGRLDCQGLGRTIRTTLPRSLQSTWFVCVSMWFTQHPRCSGGKQ